MTLEQHNSWPLPPMDEMPDDVEEGYAWIDESAVIDAAAYAALTGFIGKGVSLQTAYHEHRRAHAEAIGRPYPEARHPVWPR